MPVECPHFYRITINDERMCAAVENIACRYGVEHKTIMKALIVDALWQLRACDELDAEIELTGVIHDDRVDVELGKRNGTWRGADEDLML